MIKRAIKKLIHSLGYKISPATEQPYINQFTTEKGIERFLKRGGCINTVIDVGASDGRWSRTCMKYFPDASYLLIEAQDIHRPGLESFKRDHPNGDFMIAAAGNREGEIFFNDEDPFGGLASDVPFEGKGTRVAVTTIDKQIADRNLKGPFLIKLDTHGFEVPILEGAEGAMANTGLYIIECYNYQITADNLKYFQMCEYLGKRGFSSIEIVDLMLREKDGTFWQMDMFFIPSSSKEFQYNQYK